MTLPEQKTAWVDFRDDESLVHKLHLTHLAASVLRQACAFHSEDDDAIMQARQAALRQVINKFSDYGTRDAVITGFQPETIDVALHAVSQYADHEQANFFALDQPTYQRLVTLRHLRAAFEQEQFISEVAQSLPG